MSLQLKQTKPSLQPKLAKQPKPKAPTPKQTQQPAPKKPKLETIPKAAVAPAATQPEPEPKPEPNSKPKSKKAARTRTDSGLCNHGDAWVLGAFLPVDESAQVEFKEINEENPRAWISQTLLPKLVNSFLNRRPLMETDASEIGAKQSLLSVVLFGVSDAGQVIGAVFS